MWKYGPVIAMLRNEGTLNSIESAALWVTATRPGSERSGQGATSPAFWYICPPRYVPLWQLTHPASTKSLNPCFSAAVRAFWSPFSRASQRDGVTSCRSKAPIARPTLS